MQCSSKNGEQSLSLEPDSYVEISVRLQSRGSLQPGRRSSLSPKRATVASEIRANVVRDLSFMDLASTLFNGAGR